MSDKGKAKQTGATGKGNDKKKGTINTTGAKMTTESKDPQKAGFKGTNSTGPKRKE